jgi:hypothetical protein
LRNAYDAKHILSLCDEKDSIFPVMNAQTAVNELCRYFLGDDWYDASGAVSAGQVNTNIVATIEEKYKGCRIKKRKRG